MGASIEGVGTTKIIVEGVSSLKSANIEVIPDRIEAGTYLVAGAITRGCVQVDNVRPDHLSNILVQLEQAGAHITQGDDWVKLDMQGRQPKAVDITTNPYPDFPTDMQAQFVAMNVLADGEAAVCENVFENRFMHVHELRRMGAKIKLDGKYAYCSGIPQLTAAPVMATDLRASASLVLAALMADGHTTIDRICAPIILSTLNKEDTFYPVSLSKEYSLATLVTSNRINWLQFYRWVA